MRFHFWAFAHGDLNAWGPLPVFMSLVSPLLQVTCPDAPRVRGGHPCLSSAFPLGTSLSWLASLTPAAHCRQPEFMSLSFSLFCQSS